MTKLHRKAVVGVILFASVLLMANMASAVKPNPEGTPAKARPEVWRYQLDDPAVETIMVDINGDSFRDFLLLEDGRLTFRLETGFPPWHERNQALDAAYIDAVLTVCNLDNSGYAEIMLDVGGDLWVIDGETMATLAVVPQVIVQGLTDLDSDGIAEIYAVDRASVETSKPNRPRKRGWKKSRRRTEKPKSASHYPALYVYSLRGSVWSETFTHPSCQLLEKPSQDAYGIGRVETEWYILDLDDDGKEEEILAGLPDGGGWI
ncbi:unnamed protein product, partial [marine sediment metagenome]